MKKKLFVLFLVTFLSVFSVKPKLLAQIESGRISIGAIFNGTKYWGELTDNQIWIGGEAFVRWNIFKHLSLHGTFGYNQVRMKVDEAALSNYPTYFNLFYKNKPISDYYLNRMLSGDLTLAFHILSSQQISPYLFGGVGYMNNSPLIGKTGADGGTPNIDFDGMNEKKNGLYFPVGLGFEFYLTDNLVLNFKGTYKFLQTDYLDDIPDSKANNGYGWKTNETQPVQEANTREGANGLDKLLTFGIGFSYYVFGEADYDKDGLSNSFEKQLGTDPWNPDTDGDGLKDGEEYYTYKTNPLKADTDDDGLNDYDEIHKYKTNPLKADTDNDGLNDYDELIKYKTDPLNHDSDGDGLTDGEEVNTYKTNPLNPDTDGDKLTDYDEIMKYKTNPLMPDTDGDGLNDYDEIHTYKTDPLNKDTDGDGLTDYDEIHTHKTNPLMSDTDGDGLNDYEEIYTYKTNPLNPDSDGDGLNDYDEVMKYKTNPLNPDSDGDGLNDYDEVVKYKTNPLNADTDNDGANDYKEIFEIKTNPLNPDTDGDSILDGVDDCPNEKGVPSTEPGQHGCPAVIKIGTKLDFPDILFITGKTDFNFAEMATALNLAKLLDYVNQCENLQVKIEGHASTEGNAATNQKLSEARAQKVIEWLIANGVHADKIVGAVGYGSSQPKVKEPTAAEIKKQKMKKEDVEAIRKQNRRITVEVVRTCGD